MAQNALTEPEWTLGERIRKARTTLKMDQDEFARVFGVTNKAVSQWETGTTVPRRALEFAHKVEALAAERGVSVPAQWLLFGGTSIRCNTDPDGLELAYSDPQRCLPGNWGRRSSDTTLALVQ